MRTDIKQKTANSLFKIALKIKFLQLLSPNSEKDSKVSKTHAENKPKYISIRNNIIYEMLVILEKKPKLNTQSDSYQTKTIYFLINVLFILPYFDTCTDILSAQLKIFIFLILGCSKCEAKNIPIEL